MFIFGAFAPAVSTEMRQGVHHESCELGIQHHDLGQSKGYLQTVKVLLTLPDFSGRILVRPGRSAEHGPSCH